MNRGKPLKRTAPLPAGDKPLRRHKPLQASIPAKRTVPTVPAGERKQRSRRATGFASEVRLFVRTRAGGGNPDEARCEACGTWLGARGGQYQHIYARQAGGTRDPLYNSPANAALLCGTRYTGCHGACEDRAGPLAAHMNRMGFWRRRNGQEKPGDYPIVLHGRDRKWLTTDGRYTSRRPGQELEAA